MSIKFKMYITFILVLIFAQIAISADTFITYHNEQRSYYNDDNKVQRNPDQVEQNENIVELKNPEMEIKVDLNSTDENQE